MKAIEKTSVALVFVLFCVPAANGQGAVPVGDQFQVNSEPADSLWSPSVAALSGDAFVTLWVSEGSDTGAAIQGRCHATDGTPMGEQFQVSSATAGSQRSPAVAVLDDGGFVSVWENAYPIGAESSSIEGQRHAADGKPVGEQFRVNVSPFGFHGSPSVAALTGGDFVVVWVLDGTLQGQRFATEGTPLGGQFLVSAIEPGERYGPSVAALADGGFAVTWYRYVATGADSFDAAIEAQRFTADGTVVLWGEIHVNSSPVFDAHPAIAAVAGGGFVVVWDGSDSEDILGRRFAPDSTTLGGEFQVNSHTAGVQRHPSIAATGTGGFAVAWEGAQRTIQGQRYAADGTPLGGEFQIDSDHLGRQSHPAVASLADGGFAVAWQAYDSLSDPGSSESSIQGRLFADPSFAFVGLAGECLHVERTESANGRPAFLHQCNGEVNQRWRMELSSVPQKVVGVDGRCLIPDPLDKDVATRVVAGECGGGDDLWRLGSGGHASPSYLVHDQTGLCLDVLGDPKDDFTPIALFRCHGGANQVWRPAAEVCTRDSLGLCLNQERFRLDLDWRSFDGTTGSGRAVPVGSDDSGLLWFFQADNWEMLIKVLDGCALNERLWVFAAATTTVEYTLRVTDTQIGAIREYFNPLGTAAASITDTAAFDACPAGLASRAVTGDPRADWRAALERIGSSLGAGEGTAPLLEGSCVPSATEMCLRGRFKLEVEWHDHAGGTGSARVIEVGTPSPGTGAENTSGLFWFFDPGNWEMLVKVLDGCDRYDNYLFIGAATTDVEYTLTITDMDTRDSWQEFNPLGTPSRALVRWLPACP